MRLHYLYTLCLVFFATGFASAQNVRKTESFNSNWKFFLGDDSTANNVKYDDSHWRQLDLPHDWSIEGKFDSKNPTTQAEGGLPAGIGWYRKSFLIAVSSKTKTILIDFDGVFHNSEVWINGHYLGKRPNGYISFRYDLTPYLKFGTQQNVIAVRADNSDQPNSRWYTGSGIYRNVWLTTTSKIYLPQWSSFITTPKVDHQKAEINIRTVLPVFVNSKFKVKASVLDDKGKVVGSATTAVKDTVVQQGIRVSNPQLWSVKYPYLYKVKLQLMAGDQVIDDYITTTGIRYFNFDADKGFSLNGEPMKILGVCLHHDQGALGTAVNTRAIERQLQILKDMGCNAIRTSHNPPAPELLDLCDKMGFLVMDEAFDMWKKKKSKHDYHEDWDKWHVKDLQDQVLRDRNHPSIFAWSIGNEIREQFDSTGVSIGRELVKIVKQLDSTRPVTSALSDADPKKNFIYQSGALDLIGLNYHQEVYADFQKNYPDQKFIGTENMSALATRGHYDMPSDSIRRWPKDGKTPLKDGNADLTVSSYDNVSAYWGSTHEETWKIIKKHNFLSGLFVWTGFDYIGEPTPYLWPARSSYFGIVDLAGFPKDVYYMYQSEWTNKPVLHLLPHWNWKPGQMIDVWAYYNNADEVEAFLNGKSIGVRKKTGDDLHVMWRVKYEPGVLKAVSRRKGKVVMTTQVVTAGEPYKLQLKADRSKIKADGKDLSYITVSVLDKNNVPVADANQLVKFKVTGQGILKGVDNGSQTDQDPFVSDQHHLFNGLGLAIIQSKSVAGEITIRAAADGLQSACLTIKSVR
ncbi:glycoside hydrolase family 2 TIM barrel-domain containing protein [Mucilaginibacter sp. SJ]|uniref:glycoside hydrolase family 2 TIM barrel-domain containing protein n=1 Tax=Mucilaginibacter sp. SJ TaxID=3029053 RepID=UPI0023A9DCE4|nr:glycoside hydrolase family 2 TIM barrel-domain containing protein [Mucilaginibacter sp. SJ]WEA03313.1 glycoside hydrolase family 2 TIM barrel-domain containing protein [Mucilaginibacter sp. SJ]